MASVDLTDDSQGIPTNLSLSLNVLIMPAFVSITSYPRVSFVYDAP